VLIAGDAAHSHPPYGGFGLNSVWKTRPTWVGSSRRCSKAGGRELIRSYSEERRPIFKETGEDFIAARINADAACWNSKSRADKAEFETAWAARQSRAGAAC